MAAFRRLSVKCDGAGDITGLEACEVFRVAVGHELTGRAGVIEPDRVADFMGQRIAQIVSLEIAVEADLPRLLRIEADERARNRTGMTGDLLGQLDIGEGAADRMGLRADQQLCGCCVAHVLEANVGDGLPLARSGGHLTGQLGGGEAIAVRDPVEWLHALAVAGAGEVHRPVDKCISHGDRFARGCVPPRQRLFEMKKPKGRVGAGRQARRIGTRRHRGQAKSQRQRCAQLKQCANDPLLATVPKWSPVLGIDACDVIVRFTQNRAAQSIRAGVFGGFDEGSILLVHKAGTLSLRCTLRVAASETAAAPETRALRDFRSIGPASP